MTRHALPRIAALCLLMLPALTGIVSAVDGAPLTPIGKPHPAAGAAMIAPPVVRSTPVLKERPVPPKKRLRRHRRRLRHRHTTSH